MGNDYMADEYDEVIRQKLEEASIIYSAIDVDVVVEIELEREYSKTLESMLPRDDFNWWHRIRRVLCCNDEASPYLAMYLIVGFSDIRGVERALETLLHEININKYANLQSYKLYRGE